MTGAPALRFLIALSFTIASASNVWADLRSYVKADDQAYGWHHVARTDHADGVVVHELQLTSQVWQGISWRHRLQIIIPPSIPDQVPLVLMIITGTDRAEQQLRDGAFMAQSLKAPVAILHDIPNQPLFGGLAEDDLLAHTFVRFLETRDMTWPLLLPMVKGAVRAMDAIQAFMQRQAQVQVAGFMVSGASKRGWTTWLTPVVDDRVKAIAPLVYDNLNLAQQLRHQRQIWGQVSGEIADYTARGLPQRLLAGEQGAVELAAMVDPFSYRQQLTIPKLIILGTNDPYWPLDALNLYYDALPGERYILYVPNAGHHLRPGRERAIAGLMALFRQTANQQPLPTLHWEAKTEGAMLTLSLASDRQPEAVRAWISTALTNDFREARWEAVAMQAEGNTYVYRQLKRSGHITAIFGEAEYRADTGSFVLSTTVSLFR